MAFLLSFQVNLLFLSSRKIVESIEWVNTLKDDENIKENASNLENQKQLEKSYIP